MALWKKSVNKICGNKNCSNSHLFGIKDPGSQMCKTLGQISVSWFDLDHLHLFQSLGIIYPQIEDGFIRQHKEKSVTLEARDKIK